MCAFMEPDSVTFNLYGSHQDGDNFTIKAPERSLPLFYRIFMVSLQGATKQITITVNQFSSRLRKIWIRRDI